MNDPRTQLLLVEDFGRQRFSDSTPDLDELRERLLQITGVDTVEVTAQGRSSAVATLPARNERERERLKDLVDRYLKGWKVVERQQYSLPQTF